MLPRQKNFSISPENISELLKIHCADLMKAFYEEQSSFLCTIYKRYSSIETANITLCFLRNVNLEIIRQRERDLNYNISLNDFWKNLNKINKPLEKIATIVNATGIPKETVRRKIKTLSELGFVTKDKKSSGYYLNISLKEKDMFLDYANHDTSDLAKFISKFANYLKLNINTEIIEKELKSQFSFYWYHFLSCQLDWLKMWQLKFKDNDLLLISLQTTIPTLQYIDKNIDVQSIDDVYKYIGKISKENKNNNCSISATSVSDITGIPRATCIRKLDRLVNLGFLTRMDKSKRYSVNQSIDSRTKNITHKDNIVFTIKTYSKYLSIILNSLIYNRL